MLFSSVLFDFDGTMFDTRNAIRQTIIATFVEKAIMPPSDERVDSTLHMGATLERTFELLWNGDPRDLVVEGWVATYRQIYNSGVGTRESVPYTGIVQALEAVKRLGGTVVVASNKGEAAIHNTLHHHNLASHVSLVVAARDAQPTKPDPKSFFERIQPQLGALLSERVLVVGDTITDIQYARAIGAVVCWAAYGYGDPDQCAAGQPDFTIHNPAEVLQILGGKGE